VIQLTATVFPLINVPSWATTLVVVLAAIGFPVATALAWAFDVTPDGVQRTHGSVAAAPRVPARASEKSIAVLPFLNISADPENEYFSDGITEEIIDALSHVEGLQVAARTSSFAFKGKDVDIATIAERLGVATVLEGSVRKSGNQLRITAQLINAADGYHLWSERFDRDLEDVFAIQDEISHAIVAKLRGKLLTESEQEAARRRYTENLEVYNLYLQGRYYWTKRNQFGLSKSVGFFEKAVQLDPSYAPAHAGLADSYAVIGFYGFRRPADIFRAATAEALRALEIDDTLPEPHLSRGLIAFWYERDWALAEREMKRAIELNRSYAEAHVFLGQLYAAIGRRSEAFAHADGARELAPLSALIHAVGANPAMFFREYDKARDLCEEALQLDASSVVANWVLTLVESNSGHHERAIEAATNTCKLSNRAPVFVGQLAQTLARSGKEAEARDCIAELDERSKSEYVAPYSYVLAYNGLRDRERTLLAMDKAVEERNSITIFLRQEPACDWLRGDPRFEEIIARLKLPPARS
jgi:TolB-like protein